MQDQLSAHFSVDCLELDGVQQDARSCYSEIQNANRGEATRTADAGIITALHKDCIVHVIHRRHAPW